MKNWASVPCRCSRQWACLFRVFPHERWGGRVGTKKAVSPLGPYLCSPISRLGWGQLWGDLHDGAARVCRCQNHIFPLTVSGKLPLCLFSVRHLWWLTVSVYLDFLFLLSLGALLLRTDGQECRKLISKVHHKANQYPLNDLLNDHWLKKKVKYAAVLVLIDQRLSPSYLSKAIMLL